MRFSHVVLVACLAPLGLDPRPAPRTGGQADARADAVLDTAAARMGGAPALRRVERMRLEMLTQWQRTAFDARPYADAPSYELHTELRDYALPAWRNTRRFVTTGVPAAAQVTDLVRDSVAVRRATVPRPAGPASPGGATPAGAWAPLNVAYVDERRELFAFAPERVLLLARAAADRRALPDTAVGGLAHARVAATVDGFPAVLFVRRGDGFLAMARYRAAHPNDFGLTQWGPMEVEVWYSQWAPLAPGLRYPRQWDVRRVGRPYRRMTVLDAAVNPPAAAADSFAVSDSLRAAFRHWAARPMHDLPLDSARAVHPRVVAFRSFAGPAGAVRLGRRWVLLEAGRAPLNAERASAWLDAHAAAAARDGSRAATGGTARGVPSGARPAGAPLAGAVLTETAPDHGGAAWLARRGVRLYAAPGAAAAVAVVLRNHGVPASAAGAATVGTGRWLRADGDSLWLEPLDLPDAPGALVAWVPSLRWVYGAAGGSRLGRDLLLEHARARGWVVDQVGSPRAMWTPATPAAPAGSGRAP
jgi:hypothetical protein